MMNKDEKPAQKRGVNGCEIFFAKQSSNRNSFCNGQHRGKQMKRNITILIFTLFAILSLSGGAWLAFRYYHGSYLGEEQSPDGKFSLRYYKSVDPFRIRWSMPGDGACDPLWVRLFDQKGRQLNELRSSSCMRENQVLWTDGEVFLSDGITVWKLPERQ